MKQFKNSFIYLTAFLLSFSVLASVIETQAQQVTSDYQIKDSFRSDYNTLSDRVDSAKEPQEMEEIIEQIKAFEQEYAEHEELLDKVLYPSSLDEKLESLKKRAVLTQNRVTTIKKQEEMLNDLGSKVSDYDSRMQELNRQTDSLQAAIKESKKNEQKLSGLVRQYRQRLEQRDELIITMVDSVLITYKDMEIESMENLEKATEQARLSSGENALAMVRSIAEQNVSFLNSNPTLSTNTLVRMSAVQQRFEDMWDKVGKKLAEIYSEDNPDETYESTSKTIATWDEKVTSRTWTSLNDAFNKAGIEMDKFADSESFYSHLNTYLDNSIEESNNKSNETQYEKYKNFTHFWHNRVKPEWAAHMPRAEILNSGQIAAIDQKVDQWAVQAEPESSLFVYLLGVSLVAAIVFGVLFVREKRVNGA